MESVRCQYVQSIVLRAMLLPAAPMIAGVKERLGQASFDGALIDSLIAVRRESGTLT